MQPTHLVLHLVDREIERCRVLRSRGGALHEMVIDVHQNLTRMRIGSLPSEVLCVVDIHSTDVVRVFLDPLQLLFCERSQSRVDFRVLSDDDEVHATPVAQLGVVVGV